MTAGALRRCRVESVAAALLAALVASGCGREGPGAPAAMPPVEVKVVQAQAKAIPVVREYVGSVNAYRSVQVRARVEGILQRRAFVEGTDVKPGQLLYSIDPARYEAALRDSQAALAQAEANLANARLREGRFAPLVKESAISRQDYDDALTQLRNAEASVQAARANVDRARLDLGYTNIVATESGRVGTSLVPEGALVGRGEATLLTTIDRLDPIYVSFTMPDREALALQRAIRSGAVREGVGERVRFILPDGSEHRQAGRLDFADAQVNRDTGSITLRAVLPNRTDPPLLPGMFVRVAFTVGQRVDAILVPQQSVSKVPSGHVAYVVSGDGKTERRDLVVGEWVGDDWVIEKGLAAGDTVVVEGIQKIQPGATVRAVPWKPAAQGAAPAAAPGSPSAR